MKLLVLAILFTAACQPGPPISPLIAAARAGDTARIAQLIATGADVNLTAGAHGRDTALRLAELAEDQTVATLLREHGAKTPQ
jgi:ankyrin repeat protein